MTVESNPFPFRYSGNGSTKTFTVDGYFLAEADGAAHLKVVLRSATGSETVLVQGADYSVTGAGNENGGSVTLTTAPATGETLVILRNVPETQQTDYPTNGPLPAVAQEQALDKLTMMVQQRSGDTGKAIVLPDTDATTLVRVLPASSVRAGKALIFDTLGNVTISDNDYADIEAQQTILIQSQQARDAAQGYAQDAAEYYDLVLDAPIIAASATVDRFSGNDATTSFTLSATPLNEENTLVYIGGVYQQKDTYSVSGTTLTFSEAPPTGTDNIEVSTINSYTIGTPSDATISTAKIVDKAVTLAKVQDIATDRLLGRESSGSGVIEQITLGTGLELSGGALQFTTGGIGTTALANNSVTKVKFEQIATAKILGRATAGTGNVEEVGIGSGLAISGGNLIATGAGTGDMLAATYDPAGVAQQVLGTTATQTMTNKTATNLIVNGALTGTAVLDEDSMTSNSDTKVPTQQSVKAYVDTGLATKAASSHTQAASTITDFQEAVEDVIGAAITAGTNITVSYNDGTGKTTINASTTASASYKLEQAAISSPPAAYAAQWGYAGAAGATQIQAGAFTSSPTAYTYMKDLASWRTHFNNAAGYQQSYTSDSGGRTMLPVHYIEGYHSGFGDCNGFASTIGVGRHTNWASATRWTGFNSATGFSSDVGAVGAGNVNLYGAEFQIRDEGYSTTSGLGLVLKLFRNSAVTAVDTLWTGVRVDSEGAADSDVAFQANGKFKNGLDFSGAALSGTLGKAIILRTNHAIVFNSPQISAPTDWYHNQHGGQPVADYLTHDGNKFVFVQASVPLLQLSNSALLYAPNNNSRFRVNTASTDVVADFKVAASLDGSNYFRVQASAITCNKQLDVASGSFLNFSSSFFDSSTTLTGLYGFIQIKIDGVTKKIPVYHLA